MDLTTLLSSLDENKLKCFNCHNFLSHFPISVCSNKKSLCGRCEAPKGITCFEDEAFEALSHNLHFPCRYKPEGCVEELLPEDVPQHERNCQYRVVPCIVDPKECDWTGSLPLLYSHCKKEHSQLILKNGVFEMDLSASGKNEHFLESEDLLIFNTKFYLKTKDLYCALYYNQYQSDVKSSTFQLKISNADKTLLLDLNTTNFNEAAFVKLSLKSIISSNNTKIRAQIVPKSEETKTELSQEVNQKLLSFLKCYNCNELVNPPVYYCFQSSKVLCSSCFFMTHRNCEFCKSRRLGILKVPVFEELSKMVLYPCKYEQQGCSSKLKHNTLNFHHAKCQFQNCTCPLSTSHCRWTGIKKEVDNHLLTQHGDVIKNCPFESVIKDGMNCDFVKFRDRFFRVCYGLRHGHTYVWSVQTVGDYTDEFSYEVQIFGEGDVAQSLVYKQKCLPLTSVEKVFDAGQKYCYFYVGQLAAFPVGDEFEVKFKINVVK